MIVCDVCRKPAVLVQSDRTEHVAYACPDQGCPGYRSFLNPRSRAEIVADQDGAPENDRCPACGEPRGDHIGPPSPPLIRGHLGATEDRPGACLTKTGEHVHRQNGEPTDG